MEKDWLSIHIFYYGDLDALLVHCVAPLIAELREQHLIERYFFIKYWMEGSHIRLRLLPAPGIDKEKVQSLAETAIAAFLRERPAFYRPDYQQVAPYYKKAFVHEYGEQKWLEKYGEHGTMPLRANNTFALIPYEPEYERYGGVEGIELAEWHFERSSDIVLELLSQVNVNVSPIRLGMSMQLALPFFFGLFDEDHAVLDALERYIRYWFRGSPYGDDHGQYVNPLYTKKYTHMSAEIQTRVTKIRQYMLNDVPQAHLTAKERAWKNHIGDLRQRIDLLFERKTLAFTDGGQKKITFETRHEVYQRLLGSYLHMTNNRLGVTIPQEVYLAYLLKQGLQDLASNNRQKEAIS